VTFKFVRASDQTSLPCKFGANPFSSPRDISYTNEQVTDSAQNRTLRSSLRAANIVIIIIIIITLGLLIKHEYCYIPSRSTVKLQLNDITQMK